MLKKRLMCLCSVTVFIAAMCFNVITFAGDLEPTAPPASTMKTLDEIPPTWSQKLPVADRFELVLDGAAVLDKETGLVWEQSPSTVDRPWTGAKFDCLKKKVGGRGGWHLPTVEGLHSLVDGLQSNPSLPSGYDDFFTNVKSDFYWTSTTTVTVFASAYYVDFYNGGVDSDAKTVEFFVWCVRGGHSHTEP